MTNQFWLDECYRKKLIINGFECLILRIRERGGHLCGYIRIPKDHPIYEIDSNRSDIWPEIHGGWSYDRTNPEDTYDTARWVGFDCAHLNDLSPLSDTQRGGIYRTMEYVEKELKEATLALRQTEKIKELIANNREPRTITLYAIRQKSTGFYLPYPAGSSGRGGTHVEPVSPLQSNPRLFTLERAAKSSLTYWLGGKISVHHSDYGGEYDETWSTKFVASRRADDMEVIPVELKLP